MANSNKIITDINLFPNAFWVSRKLEKPLDSSLFKNKYIKNKLLPFWNKIGGALELFETEQILYPVFDKYYNENVVERTNWYLKKGLNNNFLVFSESSNYISVIDLNEGSLYILDIDNFSIIKRFSDLNKWYDYIRKQFIDYLK